MQTNPSSAGTDLQADNLRRAEIDKSVKGPVLFLFLNGAFWLMASTILGVLAAIKMFAPSFLGDCSRSAVWTSSAYPSECFGLWLGSTSRSGCDALDYGSSFRTSSEER